jgi:vacuolar protein sorting-associated protein 13A/C
MGGLKGITGLVIKPVSGIIDATTKTAEGIKNTPGYFS